MSGIGETVSAHLARYFERRLTQVGTGDVLRCEPEGYRTEYHDKSQRCVLRHLATGIRIGADCIDLVERVDRGQAPENTCVVYCYLPEAAGGRAAFSDIQRLANRQPRDAFKALIKCGALVPVSEPMDDEDVGDPEWYGGHLAALDPADVGRWLSRGTVVRDREPWYGAEFCVALYVSGRSVRPATGRSLGVGEVLEMKHPGLSPSRAAAMADGAEPHATELQVDQSYQLIEYAAKRDAAGVRECLAAGADPTTRDSRGWTALHAAAGIRPCWEVLELLIPVSDLCARSNAGHLPLNLAEEARQEETAEVLRDVMRRHKKGKYLING
mmetsp:Transcript_42808/g.80280  ORF Transcript_42808/g.80280 Transcript_42808/m.80280 type:complete len:327 (+) Transcript_42808:87-1067(+)